MFIIRLIFSGLLVRAAWDRAVVAFPCSVAGVVLALFLFGVVTTFAEFGSAVVAVALAASAGGVVVVESYSFLIRIIVDVIVSSPVYPAQ